MCQLVLTHGTMWLLQKRKAARCNCKEHAAADHLEVCRLHFLHRGVTFQFWDAHQSKNGSMSWLSSGMQL